MNTSNKKNWKKTKSNLNRISSLANFNINIILVLFLILCIAPVFLVVSLSLSQESDIREYGYKFIPRTPTFEAYRYIIDNSSDLFHSYRVTIGITVIGSLLSTLVTALYAYPLSRRELRFKKFFSFYIVIPMLFNGGLVPWYIVCSQLLHITDSYLALLLPLMFNTWHVVIMRTFFKLTIPQEIIESAIISGAGEFRIFFSIVSPLVKAGYATITLFATLLYWNDWWHSLILTSDKKFYTLQYYIYKVLTEINIIQQMAPELGGRAFDLVKNLPAESARFAMCLFAMGPILFIYPFFQKHFVKGLTIGSIKG